MLSPYTVLDLTDDRGELAAMILGDLGADVIKVEPPHGSSSRRMAPFLPAGPEPERSLHYFAFNRNKRGITLDLAGDAGRCALLRLAERTDFVIESARPGEMSGLGLGFEEMRQANPRIVYRSHHSIRPGRPIRRIRRQRPDDCGHGRPHERAGETPAARR